MPENFRRLLLSFTRCAFLLYCCIVMPGPAVGLPGFEPLGSLGGAGRQHPSSSLLPHRDGNFYGTTYNGGGFGKGTLYKVTPSGALNVVVHFSGVSGSTAGTQPVGGLISDAAGILWGVTAGGGANDIGTIFTVDPLTRVLTTIVSFTGVSGAAPGHSPVGGLVSNGAGNYWGTTFAGGANGLGTVFKLQTNTSRLTSVASFTGLTGPARGGEPAAGLVSDGAGFLWGTTRSGGSGPGAGNGTVFKVNLATNALSTVVNFSGTTGAARGAAPSGGLVSDGAGFLWGTTEFGGDCGCRKRLQNPCSDSYSYNRCRPPNVSLATKPKGCAGW